MNLDRELQSAKNKKDFVLPDFNLISNKSYMPQNDIDDTSNFTWFYDERKYDKIGISSDGTQVMHDSIVFTLKKFKKVEEVMNGRNTIQLIYNLSGWNASDKSTDKSYFSDLTLHEKGTYLDFKYVENSKGEMVFVYITFNGRVFKQ